MVKDDNHKEDGNAKEEIKEINKLLRKILEEAGLSNLVKTKELEKAAKELGIDSTDKTDEELRNLVEDRNAKKEAYETEKRQRLSLSTKKMTDKLNHDAWSKIEEAKQSGMPIGKFFEMEADSDFTREELEKIAIKLGLGKPPEKMSIRIIKLMIKYRLEFGT